MRIAITVDPEIPVPPKLYGGIERIVDMLVRGLVALGHEVTLFAHPDSDVPCRLEPYPGQRSRGGADLLRNMSHVFSKVVLGKYDLVHSFGRLAYLFPLFFFRIPKIMSYQRTVTPKRPQLASKLSRRTLHFTGCSRYIIREQVGKSNWHVIYNGTSLSKYHFTKDVPAEAPLLFLGRLESFKGVHVAIEVAKRSCRPLVIAGNVPSGDEHKNYYEEKIAPHVDGKFIRYVGLVNDEQKNMWLGQAAALLMPLLGEEAFGIVMAEALACGTPVIGFNRGPIPEIVEDGVNGFLCNTVDEMVCSVVHIEKIKRSECRRIAEEKFSDKAIVGAYEKLYLRLIGEVA